MFETSNTYGIVGSSFTGSNNQSFSTRTSLGEEFCGSSYKSTTSHSSYASKNSISNQSTRTISGSFVEMHRNTISTQPHFQTLRVASYSIEFPDDDYDTPPTGELDDSFASPVGDVLLPLLLMAAAYAVVRWFKNWKKRLTEKRLFCIK